MTFLAPVFFVGLAALAIPIIIHLIQRERKRVVEFPSLMFLRRIPYQSVRRRTIRHWLLLLMRMAAIALIVVAFARPFFRRGPLAQAASGGAREVAILLDRSASMAYGDHWQRARTAAHRAIQALGPDDRATLVLFARNAEENVRATGDRARLNVAVDAAKVGSGATRYGPALKLAQSILGQSALRRREAILISDFQRTGWTGAEDVRFPEGTLVTPVSVADASPSNVAVTSVSFARSTFSNQERVAVTAGVINRGLAAVKDLEVGLDIDGQHLQSQRVTVAPNASASVTFAPFTLADANVRGIVRAGSDALPQDNAFDFVLTPGRPVSVLIVNQQDVGGGRSDPSLYVSKALSIGSAPAFQVDVAAAARVTPASFDRRAVVIFNNTAFPTAAAGGVLKRFVERGGGIIVVLGERSTWPSTEGALLPGTLGTPVDRLDGRGGTLGYLDYSHPVFELFKAPRSGDFSGVRVFRYRALMAGPSARVLARYDDGAVAAAEQRAGDGRVIAWGAALDDSWSDLALKPIFLPLVHQLVRYVAHYEEPAAWYTVGQVLDLAGRLPSAGRTDRVALAPSGQRITLTESEGPGFLELAEQGFYEIRTSGSNERRPFAVAANLDPAESDLSVMDPRELVAAVTGHASQEAGQAAAGTEATAEEVERRQALWWYLLLAGVLLLAAETIVSNRFVKGVSS